MNWTLSREVRSVLLAKADKGDESADEVPTEFKEGDSVVTDLLADTVVSSS